MKRKIFLSFIVASLIFGVFQINLAINPEKISILKDNETSVFLNIPFSYSLYNEDDLQVNGSINKEYTLNEDNISLYSNKEGSYTLTAKLFGSIPIDSYTVNVIEDIKLYPSGSLTGMDLNTKGAIAVEYEYIIDVDGKKISPAKNSGILPGDIITKIGEKEVFSAEDVINELNNITRENIEMTLDRGGEIITISIVPVQAQNDKKYKIGLWVRDNVAGIGTITCISEDEQRYVALGHSINDINTNIIIPVKNGNILESEIVSIVKGRSQDPGEIRGILKNSLDGIIGEIDTNNEYGIYGNLINSANINKTEEPLDIALQKDIKEGPAQILSTVDEEGPKYYDIYIEKVNTQDSKSTKSMVIKVTDEKLLEKTGGIIQGMSGSPIIQEGKIIGAVTHVFVNDPTKGYGIFIEWLLEDLINIQN